MLFPKTTNDKENILLGSFFLITHPVFGREIYDSNIININIRTLETRNSDLLSHIHFQHNSKYKITDLNVAPILLEGTVLLLQLGHEEACGLLWTDTGWPKSAGNA